MTPYKPKQVRLQVEFDPEPSAADKAAAQSLAERITNHLRSEAQSALRDRLDNQGRMVTCHYEEIDGSWYLICE